MANGQRRTGTRILILSLLVVLFGITILLTHTDVFADLNTLESTVNQTRSSWDSAQIGVGENPRYVYSDPYTSYEFNNTQNHTQLTYSLSDPRTIYVANSDSNTVSVIDTKNNNVIVTIPVGDSPQYMYGNLFDSPRLFVSNRDSDTISVIDTKNNNVTATIPVGDSPQFVYGHPSLLGHIYVSNSNSSTVSVIDTKNNNVTATIPVGDNPQFIYGNRPASYRLYVANAGSDSISVINIKNNSVTATIPVGKYPQFIYGNQTVLYVANSLSGTISVVNITNSKYMTHNITVGNMPLYIYGDLSKSNNIYVANLLSNTTSVIDTNSDSVHNITVGDGPAYIYGDLSKSNKIYVANIGSNTVSVIDTKNNSVTATIPVGKSPRYIYGSGLSNALYVANSDSKGLSLINSDTNEVVAGTTFDVQPFGRGQIICMTDLGKLKAPINQLLYVSSGTKCIASPIKGYEFTSWSEILEGNSTRIISTTTTSGSPWVAFLDFFNIKPDDPSSVSPFTAFLNFTNIKSDDPASILTINQFGNFSAYFTALPPPVPTEYWATLFSVIATALVGSLLIPAGIGWFKSKKQTSRLNSYHQEMVLLRKDGLDEKDIGDLNTLNQKISDEYSKGKINNDQYENLKKEISALYDEKYKKEIDSLKESADPDGSEIQLEGLNKNVTEAYSKDRINNEHFKGLKNEISIAYKRIFNRRIELISKLSISAGVQRIDTEELREAVSEAYSDNKITKIHYDLLNERISKAGKEDGNDCCTY